MNKREQLERTLADLKQIGKQLDAKGWDNATMQEAESVISLSTQVNMLSADIKAAEALRHDTPAPTGLPTGITRGMLEELGGATTHQAKSVGSLGAPTFDFTRDDVAHLQKAAIDRRIATKAVSTTQSPMSLVGDYRMSPFPYLRDRTRILDLIPTEQTDAPTVFYFRATTAAAAAAAVDEGANKPESTPAWEQVSSPVRKLAHFARVNDEVIADFNGFLNVIGTEMLAGLIDEENDQLLNGSGVAPNLTGLLTTTGIQTVGSAGTDLDAIAEAANKVRTGAFVEPDTVVMHPNDWASTGFLLAKDSSGQYLVGNPLQGTAPSLWGMRVVLTTRMTENSVMVANLKEAARVYVRQGPSLEVQPGGGTAEFIANQTLIRAEERLALAVVRPSAICTVTAV